MGDNFFKNLFKSPFLIRGEPEQAPNTWETGSGVYFISWLTLFLGYCQLIYSIFTSLRGKGRYNLYHPPSRAVCEKVGELLKLVLAGKVKAFHKWKDLVCIRWWRWWAGLAVNSGGLWVGCNINPLPWQSVHSHIPRQDGEKEHSCWTHCSLIQPTIPLLNQATQREKLEVAKQWFQTDWAVANE